MQHHQPQEAEYKTIFESASDGLVIYDVALDSIIEANQAACKMHNYTENGHKLRFLPIGFGGLTHRARALPQFVEALRASRLKPTFMY